MWSPKVVCAILVIPVLIAMLSAALSSYDEVKKHLAKVNIHLSVDLIIKISKHISKLARLCQSAEKYLSGFKNTNTIVVSIDGGRIRIRSKKRGPKTAKKRNRFKGQWREVLKASQYRCSNHWIQHDEYQVVVIPACSLYLCHY